MNLNNYGTAKGNVARIPNIRKNADGSHTIFLTLGVQNNYVSKDGTRHSKFIDFEAFVSKDREPKVYQMLETGDFIEVLYEVGTSKWTDAETGEDRYRQYLSIQQVNFLESKSAKEDRKARNL